MEAIIKLIMLAYMMEGIKASDVAILVNREDGRDVFRCMAPQQHYGKRAIQVKQRIEQQLKSYVADTSVNPGKAIHDGVTQQMYVVEVRVTAGE